MLKWGSRAQFIARLIAAILLLPSVSAIEAKTKKSKEVPKGTPVLWRAPQDIAPATCSWDQAVTVCGPTCGR